LAFIFGGEKPLEIEKYSSISNWVFARFVLHGGSTCSVKAEKRRRRPQLRPQGLGKKKSGKAFIVIFENILPFSQVLFGLRVSSLERANPPIHALSLSLKRKIPITPMRKNGRFSFQEIRLGTG